jgi:hypothetical protein
MLNRGTLVVVFDDKKVHRKDDRNDEEDQPADGRKNDDVTARARLGTLRSVRGLFLCEETGLR